MFWLCFAMNGMSISKQFRLSQWVERQAHGLEYLFYLQTNFHTFYWNVANIFCLAIWLNALKQLHNIFALRAWFLYNQSVATDWINFWTLRILLSIIGIMFQFQESLHVDFIFLWVLFKNLLIKLNRHTFHSYSKEVFLFCECMKIEMTAAQYF